MSIFYADKEQLERQTGTDLIYYRHHRPGFILVQYKRMRTAAGSREATYYPDDQLRRELARARALPTAATPRHPNEWRLTEDSFYVKLVADDLARPTANKWCTACTCPAVWSISSSPPVTGTRFLGGGRPRI